MRRLKLPEYDRPIRYICTRCGGWWEGDANRLIVAGITGYEPEDPDLQKTISARQIEMVPIARHRERCDGDIRTITANSPEWETLDPNRRENGSSCSLPAFNMEAQQPKKKKPLQQLELICIIVAAMPGILMFTGARVQNQAQAVFRISVFLVGLLGFIAVKIYQHKKMREGR